VSLNILCELKAATSFSGKKLTKCKKKCFAKFSVFHLVVLPPFNNKRAPLKVIVDLLI